MVRALSNCPKKDTHEWHHSSIWAKLLVLVVTNELHSIRAKRRRPRMWLVHHFWTHNILHVLLVSMVNKSTKQLDEWWREQQQQHHIYVTPSLMPKLSFGGIWGQAFWIFIWKKLERTFQSKHTHTASVLCDHLDRTVWHKQWIIKLSALKLGIWVEYA